MFPAFLNYSNYETKVASDVRVKFLTLTVFLLITASAFSQSTQVLGKFLHDSVSIGEPLGFALVAKYDLSVDVLFPDSLADVFGSFEYLRRDNFPTYTSETKLVDSSVFWLQTFDIDSIFYLQLPVIVFAKADSSKVFSNLDSVIFRHLAVAVSDTTKLVTNTDFFAVKRIFNTPLFGIVLGVLGIVILLVTLIFGKRIMRYFAVKKLKKEYSQFDGLFTQIINDIRHNPSPNKAEEGISLVKHYLSKLEKTPYASYTTAELLDFQHFQKLKDVLKTLDRAIYSGKIESDLFKPLQQIEDFVQDRYKEALDNLTHGK